MMNKYPLNKIVMPSETNLFEEKVFCKNSTVLASERIPNGIKKRLNLPLTGYNRNAEAMKAKNVVKAIASATFRPSRNNANQPVRININTRMGMN